jgi:hypothetical protein
MGQAQNHKFLSFWVFFFSLRILVFEVDLDFGVSHKCSNTGALGPSKTPKFLRHWELVLIASKLGINGSSSKSHISDFLVLLGNFGFWCRFGFGFSRKLSNTGGGGGLCVKFPVLVVA